MALYIHITKTQNTSCSLLPETSIEKDSCTSLQTREIRTQMASSASETTNVTSVDDKETEEQQTSEALVERTDSGTVAFTATDTSEENLETAVCNSCMTLKAKAANVL